MRTPQPPRASYPGLAGALDRETTLTLLAAALLGLATAIALPA